MMMKASKYDFRAAAPLEAMACGTPCVRAIIQGDEDLVDGENCLRTGYDARAFYEAGKRLLGDVSLHDRLRKNGLAYVERALDWNDKIDAIEYLYSL